LSNISANMISKDEILMKKILMVGIGLTVIIAAGFFAGLQYFLRSQTKQEIYKQVEENSYVENLEYENLKVGFWGNRVYLNNISIKVRGVKEIIRARKLTVFNMKTDNHHLLGLNVEIKGVNIPLKSMLSDEIYQALNMVNEDEWLSNIGWFYQYDPDHKILIMENIKIIAPELATIEASIKLLNIDPSTILSNNLVGLLSQAVFMSLSQANVAYNDHSLLRKIQSVQNDSTASALPSSFEVISENVKQMLQKETDEKTRRVLESFLKFLDNPEKLNITLSPEKPIPLGRLLWVRHPKEAVELLNMEIET
jgi:hypothetical protein